MNYAYFKGNIKFINYSQYEVSQNRGFNICWVGHILSSHDLKESPLQRDDTYKCELTFLHYAQIDHSSTHALCPERSEG